MGYDQYTIPDTVAVEPAFVAFLYHSQTYNYGLACHSYPQYLSGLSRALFPTTFLEIAVYVF